MIQKGNTFVLCCRTKGRSCPEITFHDEEVHIKDDYNNTIKMKRDEFMDIANVIKHIQDPKETI